MKKIIFFSVMGLLCLSFSILQQINPKESLPATEINEALKPLKIGEKIPLAVYEQAMPVTIDQGAGLGSIRLSDYKGKFILLDFWAAWCSSCIKKFPMLDSLQQKYKDEVAIILVNTKSTRDTRQAMQDILNGSAAPFFSSNLNNIYGDTLLNTLFPHPYLPHYVWLGKKGELKVISDSSILNENTLKALLAEARLTELKKKR